MPQMCEMDLEVLFLLGATARLLRPTRSLVPRHCEFREWDYSYLRSLGVTHIHFAKFHTRYLLILKRAQACDIIVYFVL